MHRADGWRDVLEPVVEFYRERDLRRYFRGNAAFASPEAGVIAPHMIGRTADGIKEGKNAIKWTRLSRRKFRDNAIRLQLHALA